MSNIVVDDTDPSLTYSGQWTLFAGGSSRQWNSTVHSTFQSEATVSFQFQGSVCKVYGTVPVGNGSTVLMDVTIDGIVSPIVSQTSGSAANYAVLFYESSSMKSTWHTVVITNKGGAGNLDFEFDRVELDANDIVPTITPVPTSTPASSTSSTLPNSSLNPTSAGASITTTGVTRPASARGTVPVATVVGIVGGIIALLILILLLLLCHRRIKAKNHRFTTTQGMSQNSTVATPFTLRPSSPSATGLNAALLSPKALRQPTAHNAENVPRPFTSKRSLLSDLPLGASVSSTPLAAVPQDPPESNEADGNNNAAYRPRYLFGSTSTTAGPAHEGTITGASDVPPAYRPNE